MSVGNSDAASFAVVANLYNSNLSSSMPLAYQSGELHCEMSGASASSVPVVAAPGEEEEEEEGPTPDANLVGFVWDQISIDRNVARFDGVRLLLWFEEKFENAFVATRASKMTVQQHRLAATRPSSPMIEPELRRRLERGTAGYAIELPDSRIVVALQAKWPHVAGTHLAENWPYMTRNRALITSKIDAALRPRCFMSSTSWVRQMKIELWLAARLEPQSPTTGTSETPVRHTITREKYNRSLVRLLIKPGEPALRKKYSQIKRELGICPGSYSGPLCSRILLPIGDARVGSTPVIAQKDSHTDSTAATTSTTATTATTGGAGTAATTTTTSSQAVPIARKKRSAPTTESAAAAAAAAEDVKQFDIEAGHLDATDAQQWSHHSAFILSTVRAIVEGRECTDEARCFASSQAQHVEYAERLFGARLCDSELGTFIMRAALACSSRAITTFQHTTGLSTAHYTVFLLVTTYKKLCQHDRSLSSVTTTGSGIVDNALETLLRATQQLGSST
jgi:hypothetical protein